MANLLKYLLLVLVVLSSCKGNVERQNDKKTITVSVLPQKYFVEKIAGDNYNINVMIPPGASPVTYEPTPLQMKELSKSEIYFRIGYIEFEKGWMSKFESVNPSMQVVDLSKNADLIMPHDDEEIESEEEHEGHHHHGIDPHIWASPREVKKQAEIIYNYLSEYNPEFKEEFQNNYNEFLTEIDSLDNYISRELKSFEGRKFLIFHPALSYIARDYNLEQISIEIDGKEPTPANIQQIIDVAKKEQIRIVFVQKQFSTHNAEVIANEINGQVVQIDPLDYNWESGIRKIVDEIKKSYSN